jgi:hypothetical protein
MTRMVTFAAAAVLALSAGAAAAQQATPAQLQPGQPGLRTVDPVAEIERLQGLVREAQQAALNAQQSLREMRTQRDQARAELTATSGTVAACEYKNQRLLAVGNEILDRYKKADLDDLLGKKEPFTGIKRAHLEAVYQGYEDQFYENTYRRGSDKAPPQPAAAAEPSQTSPNQ